MVIYGYRMLFILGVILVYHKMLISKEDLCGKYVKNIKKYKKFLELCQKIVYNHD